MESDVQGAILSEGLLLHLPSCSERDDTAEHEELEGRELGNNFWMCVLWYLKAPDNRSGTWLDDQRWCSPIT